jgi:hypothetical protein
VIICLPAKPSEEISTRTNQVSSTETARGRDRDLGAERVELELEQVLLPRPARQRIPSSCIPARTSSCHGGRRLALSGFDLPRTYFSGHALHARAAIAIFLCPLLPLIFSRFREEEELAKKKGETKMGDGESYTFRPTTDHEPTKRR